MIKQILAIFIIVSESLNLLGIEKYYNSKTGFSDFKINLLNDDKILEIDNNTNKNIFNILNHNLTEDSYINFEIRLSNIHNKEGNEYSVLDNNKSVNVLNPTWGVVWNYINNDNYYLVEFKSNNSCLYDFTDERSLKINLYNIENGRRNKIKSYNLIKNIDLYEGYNTVKILVNNNNLSLFVGNKYLEHITGIYCPISGKFGYFTGPGAKTNVSRCKLIVKENPKNLLRTDFSKEKLDSIFKNSSDAYEGYWDYLDMNIQSSNTKIGGKYTIALLKNINGYDIFYIKGAKVYKSKWEPFMLKGSLIETQFINTYNLKWVGASMETIQDDAFAQFIDGVILEVNFPISKAKLRFSKRNRPQNILQPIN